MSDTRFVEDLIDQDDNFDQWYVDVIRKAELADDAPVRGCKVIRPYGWSLWENMVSRLDARFKATGVENAAFPLLIPQSMFAQEAEHIEGFAPEIAVVTHGGGKLLEEPLVVRPTSETIICPMFSRWTNSWRDLPIMINQWCSVVRWEERPRAFLRTTEFYWQEGHTAHVTAAEADERARMMQEVYRRFLEDDLAIPVVAGTKSEKEKFAGAVRTYTVEAMMGGKRWALQAGTSHNLGDNFSRVFGIAFLDRDNEHKFAFGTSWGLSQRTLGAIIMVHGDDRGLKLPPRVAPIQVIIVPIAGKGGDFTALEPVVEPLRKELASVARVRVDWRDDRSPGYKFNDWELKGVPLRLEIGPRDIASEQVVLARRDTGEKRTVSMANLVSTVDQLLIDIQDDMFATAKGLLEQHSVEVNTFQELADRAASNAGWSLAHWCGSPACEARIKAETKATIRCIPHDHSAESGRCIVDGEPSRQRVIVARAY